MTGEPAIALDNTNGLYKSQLASFALRYGGNLLTSAIPRNLVDIVELQTGRINETRAAQASDPYLYSLLNSRAIHEHPSIPASTCCLLRAPPLGNEKFVELQAELPATESPLHARPRSERAGRP